MRISPHSELLARVKLVPFPYVNSLVVGSPTLRQNPAKGWGNLALFRRLTRSMRVTRINLGSSCQQDNIGGKAFSDIYHIRHICP